MSHFIKGISLRYNYEQAMNLLGETKRFIYEKKIWKSVFNIENKLGIKK